MNVIINLNKPSGMTSQQAVTMVKRILGVKKAGHTGTLDPMAGGVLLVCLNEATKISGLLINMDKQYRARVKIGERTDTQDAQGRIIETSDISSIKHSDIINTVMKFKGRINQIPPMFSAIKIGGEILYKLARKGIEIERPERTIEIYEISINEIDLPFFDMMVLCSKGTYIRTLCEDIGNRLGTGAHLVSLERTDIGPFNLKGSLSFADLKSDKAFFYSIDEALIFLKEIILEDKDYRKAKNGMKITYYKRREFLDNEIVKLKGPAGNLFGIGSVNSGFIKIERIMNL
jgi:tRNA pseudouridine55 synthase